MPAVPKKKPVRTRSTMPEGAVRAAMPARIEPQLATLAKRAPVGQEWAAEVKFDGWRGLVRLVDGRATLFSRGQQDLSMPFKRIVAAIELLPMREAWLDGEIVAADKEGRLSFQALQGAARAGARARLFYYAFDIMYLDGWDLRRAALSDRKALLAERLAAVADPLRYSSHVVGHGAEYFAEACRLNLEGIVSKRLNASYTSGRSTSWIKVKCKRRDAFVVVGFVPAAYSNVAVGSLVLAALEDGTLQYAGSVGTGFSERERSAIYAPMAALERSTSPLDRQVRGVRWIEPRLVAEVEYAERTQDGSIRHASLKGLRDLEGAVLLADR